MKEGHCYNPATKRICRLDQAKTKKLIKLGVIVLPRDLEMPNEEPEEVIEEKNEVIEEEPEVIEPKPDIIKPLKKELKEIIKENKPQFEGITQKMSDDLLKKLLYEKLVLNKPKEKEKKKEKPKKKTKFKLKKIVVSESESESESESD
jgi:hypothetical protein